MLWYLQDNMQDSSLRIVGAALPKWIDNETGVQLKHPFSIKMNWTQHREVTTTRTHNLLLVTALTTAPPRPQITWNPRDRLSVVIVVLKCWAAGDWTKNKGPSRPQLSTSRLHCSASLTRPVRLKVLLLVLHNALIHAVAMNSKLCLTTFVYVRKQFLALTLPATHETSKKEKKADLFFFSSSSICE